MSEDLVPVDAGLREFELNQRRAAAYAASGYWPEASQLAQALVKIEAGKSMGLNPLQAMSEVHVIKGNPSLGAGALASLVKASGRYDYRVAKLTEDRCTLSFYERGEHVGDSTFTLENARIAGLAEQVQYKKYPRNMLFARAMSNGVAWYCPDVVMGRVYTPDEIDEAAIPELPPDLVDDDIPFGDPVEPDLDATEAYELEREYLNDQEAETEVLDAITEELDAQPEK